MNEARELSVHIPRDGKNARLLQSLTVYLAETPTFTLSALNLTSRFGALVQKFTPPTAQHQTYFSFLGFGRVGFAYQLEISARTKPQDPGTKHGHNADHQLSLPTKKGDTHT